ncbi:MAG: hypothetical protein IK139_07830 [Lachnospiraceae bacterium]|nr:hypothetical protein [Lachnospiraceae bacterium]
MTKATKKLQFSQKEREKIYNRDNHLCIFCRIGYHMESTTKMGYQLDGIMHYIPRSQGGLGIEQNGALGCHYHHQLMDNGNKGLRKEMREFMAGYLEGMYPGWNEKELVYNKWR